MKKFGILITFGYLLFSSSCSTEYTDYFYDKVNLHWFIISNDHYIVAKDLGDTLQIWNLTHETNSGYAATEDILVAKKVGAIGKTETFKFEIQITKITQKKIELKLKSGGQIIDFNLSRLKNEKDAFRVINIIQMQEIDIEMEKFIHTNSVYAKKSHEYLFKGYKVDKNVEMMNPEQFHTYYRQKQWARTQRIIRELEKNLGDYF